MINTKIAIQDKEITSPMLAKLGVLVSAEQAYGALEASIKKYMLDDSDSIVTKEEFAKRLKDNDFSEPRYFSKLNGAITVLWTSYLTLEEHESENPYFKPLINKILKLNDFIGEIQDKLFDGASASPDMDFETPSIEASLDETIAVSSCNLAKTYEFLKLNAPEQIETYKPIKMSSEGMLQATSLTVSALTELNKENESNVQKSEGMIAMEKAPAFSYSILHALFGSFTLNSFISSEAEAQATVEQESSSINQDECQNPLVSKTQPSPKENEESVQALATVSGEERANKTSDVSTDNYLSRVMDAFLVKQQKAKTLKPDLNSIEDRIFENKKLQEEISSELESITETSMARLLNEGRDIELQKLKNMRFDLIIERNALRAERLILGFIRRYSDEYKTAFDEHYSALKDEYVQEKDPNNSIYFNTAQYESESRDYYELLRLFMGHIIEMNEAPAVKGVFIKATAKYNAMRLFFEDTKEGELDSAFKILSKFPGDNLSSQIRIVPRYGFRVTNETSAEKALDLLAEDIGPIWTKGLRRSPTYTEQYTRIINEMNRIAQEAAKEAKCSLPQLIANWEIEEHGKIQKDNDFALKLMEYDVHSGKMSLPSEIHDDHFWAVVLATKEAFAQVDKTILSGELESLQRNTILNPSTAENSLSDVVR